MKEQKQLSVGIFSAKEVAFTFLKPFLLNGRVYEGSHRASWCDGRIAFAGETYDEIVFERFGVAPEGFDDASFVLEDVTIGVDFHWQRKENQRFAGRLKLIVEGGCITAINVIGIEDYLRSVISSEMKSTASSEFLKAHSVISRSWLLAQIERRNECEKGRLDFVETAERIIRWADREDHLNFDVCADDHCQRYQGLSRVNSQKVDEVISATWGEILQYEGKVCDARFSKCCGGTTERFSTCWEERDYPYLAPVKDAPAGGRDFCDTDDVEVLSQVLNDYDLETKDFYKWKVVYDRKSLAELVLKRSGLDFGEIRELVPLKRGVSGRIYELRIVGSRLTMTIGKELIIRKWLSESHLKSSAFDVSYEGESIILEGRGWGHGVGLCQIGAAVMGAKGYGYSEILSHYFPGSQTVKIY